MLKTQIDIERDFYTFVKNSALGSAISGNVYRSEQRPTDANTEDVVVKFLEGLDNQIQEGSVILNVYVSDIPNGKGRKIEDKARVGQIQTLLNGFIHGFSDTEYLIYSASTPKSYEVEGLSQHIIAAKINFKRIAIL